MKFYILNYHVQEGRIFLYATSPSEFPERKGLIEYCGGWEVFDTYAEARAAYPLLPNTLGPPEKMEVVWVT